jgi:hypothetical protein
MNKLLRTTGPFTYRLIAVNGFPLGRTAAGRSLKEDVAILRGAGIRPQYAVFVRPKAEVES